MKKNKAFNFVELLLVMLILGVVISLTMPLLKNIKDDEKINKSYMRKATQDVSDAFALAMIKRPSITGLDKLGTAPYTSDSSGLRNFFNTAIPATYCNKDEEGKETKSCGVVTAADDIDCNTTPEKCFIKDNKGINIDMDKDTYGFTVGGKMVMMFKYDYEAEDSVKGTPASFGYVYVDVNGKKSPNEACKDRYMFKLYNDKASIIKNYVASGAALVVNPNCKF